MWALAYTGVQKVKEWEIKSSIKDHSPSNDIICQVWDVKKNQVC